MIIRRLRRTPLRKLFLMLKPTKVDQYLYVERDEMSTVGHTLPRPLRIEMYSHLIRSGRPQYDNKLDSGVELFLAFDGEVIVHESWVFHDVLLPSQYGFQPAAPVIGDCWTNDNYRGARIYPFMLTTIVNILRCRPGHIKSFILVAPGNTPSIKGIERAGFCLLGRLCGIRILGVLIHKNMRKLRETE